MVAMALKMAKAKLVESVPGGGTLYEGGALLLAAWMQLITRAMAQ